MNTNRQHHKWTIENTINYWKEQYWHNFKFVVRDSAEEANYELTMVFDNKEKLNEEKYWIDIGKKVSELMDNLELAARMKTITKK